MLSKQTPRVKCVRLVAGSVRRVPGRIREANGTCGMKEALREQLTMFCMGKEMNFLSSMTDSGINRPLPQAVLTQRFFKFIYRRQRRTPAQTAALQGSHSVAQLHARL